MKRVMFALSIMITMVAISILAGCGGGGGGDSEPAKASITLSKSRIQIPPGYQSMIRANVTGLDPAKIWWISTGGSLAYGSDATTVYYTAGGNTGN